MNYIVRNKKYVLGGLLISLALIAMAALVSAGMLYFDQIDVKGPSEIIFSVFYCLGFVGIHGAVLSSLVLLYILVLQWISRKNKSSGKKT